MTPVQQEGRDDGGHNPDAVTFAAFYRQTAIETLRSVRRNLPNQPEAAKDVTQDSYLAMWKKWPTRRDRTAEDNVRYLKGIAARKAIDWYRSRQPVASLDGDHTFGTEDIGFTQVEDEIAILQTVRAIVEGMAPVMRAVANMYLMDGCTAAEIARTLGIASSTVRTHIQRIRKVLSPYVQAGSTRSHEGGELS